MKTRSYLRLPPFLLALFLLLPAATSRAQAPKFQDGDRICFVGDSITHAGSYHTQVLLFYLTRFPQMRLEAWNCGIAGDSAAGAVRRYDWDIAPHKPTVATIMLGMNDVNRGLYAEGKTGEAVEEQRRKAIEANLTNMDKLSERLAQDGARLIYITPSLFDQTGNQKNDKLTGVNDALKACAVGVRKLAEKYRGGVVDFNGPMDALNREGQAKDPEFTIIGADRVHPGPVGHLVMTYLFLKAQGMTPTVATMTIDAATSAITTQENAEITQLAVKADTVTFECLEKSLPFPVPAAAEKALTLVPWTNDLNQEMLKVSGLKAGAYDVLIDGQPVLKTTAEALAQGVNLATLANTPQLKQAQEVQGLLQRRGAIENGKLRTFAQVEAGLFASLKERTPEAEQKAVADKLANLRATTGQYNAYYITVYENYQASIGQREKFLQEVSDLYKQAVTAAQPKPHRFEIRPATASTP